MAPELGRLLLAAPRRVWSLSPELRALVVSFRISYCTADKTHDKVFAYIAQNQLNENLECHAFLCTKRKMVSAEEPARVDERRRRRRQRGAAGLRLGLRQSQGGPGRAPSVPPAAVILQLILAVSSRLDPAPCLGWESLPGVRLRGAGPAPAPESPIPAAGALPWLSL